MPLDTGRNSIHGHFLIPPSLRLRGSHHLQVTEVQLRLSVIDQIPSAPVGRGGEFQHALQVLTTEDGYNSGRCDGGREWDARG